MPQPFISQVAEQHEEQKQKLLKAKDDLARTQQTLKEVQSASARGVAGYLQQLEEELKSRVFTNEEGLPRVCFFISFLSYFFSKPKYSLRRLLP